MNETGLLDAYLLDGRGGGRKISWDEVRDWTPEVGPLWVHFDATADQTHHWIEHESGLGRTLAEALLADETRPRCLPVEPGLLVLLRGVNLNPGADPDDMVSIRMHVGVGRLTSLRRRRLMAVRDVAEALEAGRGPRSAGGLLAQIARRMTHRAAGVLEDLEDTVSDLEEESDEGDVGELRGRLYATRREIISLHRHLAPQRIALSELADFDGAVLEDEDRSSLRETAHEVTRIVEDLAELRERATVCKDQIAGRQADSLNRRMLVLSAVTVIFLPLSILTGLLGINVAGIPGAENEWAFLVVCLLLVTLAAFGLWLLRRLQWL